MRMENRVIKLLKAFSDDEVRAIVWKNFCEIDDALEAKTDLDLFIPESDWRSARVILLSFGFIEAKNYVVNHPGVYHYFGLDGDKVVHLNIYTRLITGESQTKLYDLPLINEMIQTSGNHFHDRILTAAPNISLHLFLIRYFIKICSIPSLFRYVLDRSDYHAEADIIEKRLCRDIDIQSIETGGLETKKMLAVYRNRHFLQHIFFGFRVKMCLRAYSRKGPLTSALYRYQQVLIRLNNKLFLKRKKRPAHRGAVIALTGLDGAGKSTSVKLLHSFFCKHFDCVTLHVGRPSPVLLTLPIRFALKLRSFAKSLKTKNNRLKKENDVKADSSIIASLRYLALAVERYKAMQFALRESTKGKIVVIDRYPSQSLHKMDGPRIQSSGRKNLIAYMSRLERWYYESMAMADLLLILQVPVDVALSRNRTRVKKDKETDEEIVSRHSENRDLKYKALSVKNIDMNRPCEITMLDIKRHAWAVIC